MTSLALLLATLAFLGLSATGAIAQSAAPIGYWTTDDNGEQLLVQANAQCSFAAGGVTQVAGDCDWNSTSGGGILSIWYPTVGGPAAVRYNIVWIDQGTISVFGDVFHRRQ